MNATDYANLAQDMNGRARAADDLHWRTTVVLGYNNILLKPTPDGFDPGPILGHDSLCATSLDRLILGGIKVIVWSPGIPYWNRAGVALGGKARIDFHKQQFEVMNDLDRLTGGALKVARSASEIRHINASGGIAILLSLSGVAHLNDMGILRAYYDLGVRMAHCAFQDPSEDTGERDVVQYDVVPHLRFHYGGRLDRNGVRTIEEMKTLGMVVDTAHLDTDGFDHVTELMEGVPFVYSHGGCGALSPNVRNFDDERIGRLAAGGGVYGIGVCLSPKARRKAPPAGRGNAGVMQTIARGRDLREREIEAASESVRDYIVKRCGEWDNWEVRELLRLGGIPPSNSMGMVVAHMEYLRERFGPEVVGYGPDYETTYTYLDGLEEADKTPHLTRTLRDRGWPEDDVMGAMGHNFIRVFDRILG